MHKAGPIPHRVADQAIAWLLALQDNASPADRERWQHWRQEHPDHERAWQRIEQVNARLHQLPSTAAHAALGKTTGLDRRQTLKSLALLVCLGSVGWTASERLPYWTAQHRTQVGERRQIALGNDLRIDLNTASAINIDVSHQHIELVEGEILVSTPSRLQVITRQGSILTDGARFAVRQHDDHSSAGVLTGQVRLQPASGSDSHPLLGGEYSTLFSSGVGPRLPLDNSFAAWIDGMLVADNMPLPHFLNELSRHRHGRLSCSGAAAALRVSGTYPLADTGHILDVVQENLSLKRLQLSPYWVRFDTA